MLYGTPIIREDYLKQHVRGDVTEKEASQNLAKQAFRQMGESEHDASTKVYSMKEDYGKGISVLMMVYNASDNPLTLLEYKGEHGASPDMNSPDQRIEPGNWSVWLWGKGHRFHGVVGTTAYNILGHDGSYVWQLSVSAGMGENCRLWSYPWWGENYKRQSFEALDDMAADSDHGTTRMTQDRGYIRTHGEISQGTSPIAKFVITRSDIGYYD